MANNNSLIEKKYHKLLKPFLNIPMFVVSGHWLVQGIRGMDRTERLFKISIDIVFTSFFFIVICCLFFVPYLTSILLSLIIAHTLNFVFNGMVWIPLKKFKYLKRSEQEYFDYTEGLTSRIKVETSFKYAAEYGSLVQGEWNPSSDWDVRLIRFPGFRNGLRACLFALRERTKAHFLRFPLDIYVYDSQVNLQRITTGEVPRVILERYIESIE